MPAPPDMSDFDREPEDGSGAVVLVNPAVAEDAFDAFDDWGED